MNYKGVCRTTPATPGLIIIDRPPKLRTPLPITHVELLPVAHPLDYLAGETRHLGPEVEEVPDDPSESRRHDCRVPALEHWDDPL